jgi:hypothetical protein
MPRAGFEPEIPMFERPKTVLALDRAAIETGPRITVALKLAVITYTKQYKVCSSFRMTYFQGKSFLFLPMQGLDVISTAQSEAK